MLNLFSNTFLYFRFGINWFYKIQLITCYGFNIKSFHKQVNYLHFELNEYLKQIEPFYYMHTLIINNYKNFLFSYKQYLENLDHYIRIRHLFHLPIRGQRTHTNAKTRKRQRKKKV